MSVTRENSPIGTNLLTGIVDSLGLHRRVPELIRFRGWPDTVGFASLLGMAVAVKRLSDEVEQRYTDKDVRRERLDAQLFMRRPTEADGCGDRWPATDERLTCAEIVSRFDLELLLKV